MAVPMGQPLVMGSEYGPRNVRDERYTLVLPDGREFEAMLADYEPHALRLLVFHVSGCEFCDAVGAEIERRTGDA